MARQLSTALSDGILAMTSFHAALQMLGESMSAFVSFFIIGLAATFGTVRFSLQSPGEELISYHRYLSWLATVIGMPYLASAYHRHQDNLFIANAHLATGFALLLLQTYLQSEIKEKATEVVSGLALISILLLSLISLNACGIIGSLGYIIAGLAIKTEGFLYGLRRVDIFHYFLVVANVAFMLGLQKVQDPIYYKPK